MFILLILKNISLLLVGLYLCNFYSVFHLDTYLHRPYLIQRWKIYETIWRVCFVCMYLLCMILPCFGVGRSFARNHRHSHRTQEGQHQQEAHQPQVSSSYNLQPPSSSFLAPLRTSFFTTPAFVFHFVAFIEGVGPPLLFCFDSL